MGFADHQYYVYILASRSRTLYIGVTNNLLRRIREHSEGQQTASPQNTKFTVSSITNALSTSPRHSPREIPEALHREEKITLIEANNPIWEDLAPDSYSR